MGRALLFVEAFHVPTEWMLLVATRNSANASVVKSKTKIRKALHKQGVSG